MIEHSNVVQYINVEQEILEQLKQPHNKFGKELDPTNDQPLNNLLTI